MDVNSQCSHCKEMIINDYILELNNEVKHFCCAGCRSVFQILTTSGLSDYYKYQDSRVKQKAIETTDSYQYLDDSEFWQKYVSHIDGQYKFTFFIEGVHCSACLWLLEKLPNFIPELNNARLNMSDSILEIIFTNQCRLSDIAKKIVEFGYKPHPITEDTQAKELSDKEEKKNLVRIGIAFACMGNIMLYSLSNYAGADGSYKELFNLYIFLCFLPVILYCATPFYRSSISALRQRKVSIDVPISVALVMGTVMGVYSLFSKSDSLYFDTLSTLVFLLLLVRYFLRKVQTKSMGFHDFKSSMVGRKAFKQLSDGTFKEVLSSFLKLGDTVKVLAHEIIPIDGKLKNGQASINNSLLTGEIKPQKVAMEDQIYCGAKNLDQELLMEVTSTLDQSRLGKILDNIQLGHSHQTKISQLSETLAQRFVLVISSLSIFCFLYFFNLGGVDLAFSRTITLLIITCPCALALTTPLALLTGMSLLAKRGVFIKDETVLENLAQAKKIFLDKTGTLTKGDFKVVDINRIVKEDLYIKILYNLEKKSQHPLAKSIVQYLELNFIDLDAELDWVEEVPGVGVKGRFNATNYQVKSSGSSYDDEEYFSYVTLYKGEDKVIDIKLADELREGVKPALDQLRHLQIDPYIVSGDKEKIVNNIAAKLGIPIQNVYSQQSPESKLQLIESHPRTIMVGDGINDALALQKAWVGIAVGGSADVSLKAAAVHMNNRGVEYIYKVICAAKSVVNNIYFNLAISLFYNIIGVYLTFSGQISPVVAAILMPISSVSVLISTLINSYKITKDIS